MTGREDVGGRGRRRKKSWVGKKRMARWGVQVLGNKGERTNGEG